MSAGMCLGEKIFQFLHSVLDYVGEKRETGHGEVDRVCVLSLSGFFSLPLPLLPLLISVPP